MVEPYTPKAHAPEYISHLKLLGNGSAKLKKDVEARYTPEIQKIIKHHCPFDDLEQDLRDQDALFTI